MDLSDVGVLKALLERHGVPARKGLGQHFLISRAAVGKIVERVLNAKGVFEIGPGPGALTTVLAETGRDVVALEVDPRMIEVLAESAPGATVVSGDALKADFRELLERLPRPRAVVSNLPYYITGPLITRIAEARAHYDRAVLMMQREVGVRVLAPAGSSDRGSLSVYLQVQFTIDKVADVPPGAFWPPPKVDSIVLEFIPMATQLAPDEEPPFFALLRKAFRQPRKTLSNNLTSAGHSREKVEGALVAAGLDLRCRPSDPNLDEWRALFRALRD